MEADSARGVDCWNAYNHFGLWSIEMRKEMESLSSFLAGSWPSLWLRPRLIVF